MPRTAVLSSCMVLYLLAGAVAQEKPAPPLPSGYFIIEDPQRFGSGPESAGDLLKRYTKERELEERGRAHTPDVHVQGPDVDVCLGSQAPIEERILHLHHAAMHLELAGLIKDAVRLRALADAERQQKLVRKLAELAALEREIAEFKQPVHLAERPVQFRLSIFRRTGEQAARVQSDCFEGNTSGSRTVCLPPGRLERLSETPDAAFSVHVLQNAEQAQQQLVEWARNGMGQMLAAPKLRVASGFPGSFEFVRAFPDMSSVGHQQVSNAEAEIRQLRTKVRVLPVLIDARRVRLALGIEVNVQTAERVVPLSGSARPDPQLPRFNAQMTLEAGQAALITGAGTTSADNAVDGSVADVLILLTPDLEENRDTPKGELREPRGEIRADPPAAFPPPIPPSAEVPKPRIVW